MVNRSDVRDMDILITEQTGSEIRSATQAQAVWSLPLLYNVQHQHLFGRLSRTMLTHH